MKLITRDTDYALRALCLIAKSRKKRVSVSELVEKLKIPRAFLRKTLQALSKKKILKSYKGSGGGFSLTLPAGKIFLADLVEVFQGPFSLNECVFKKMPCFLMRTCALKKKIDAIEKYVSAQLKSINLASLLRKN